MQIDGDADLWRFCFVEILRWHKIGLVGTEDTDILRVLGPFNSEK